MADYAIISAEMYLYGGLIGSRISNDTIDTVTYRLQRLIAVQVVHFYNFFNILKTDFRFQQNYPFVTFMVSSVVMRIPAYNGDTEEPWYDRHIWGIAHVPIFQWSIVHSYELLAIDT